MKGVQNLKTSSPKAAPENGHALTNEVYQLNYIRGNVQQFKLIQFSKPLDFSEVVRRSKDYCHSNNLRFVFVESAVTKIEVEDEEGAFIE